MSCFFLKFPTELGKYHPLYTTNSQFFVELFVACHLDRLQHEELGGRRRVRETQFWTKFVRIFVGVVDVGCEDS